MNKQGIIYKKKACALHQFNGIDFTSLTLNEIDGNS